MFNGQKILYTKQFSAIRGIQEAQTVTYELLSDEERGYGLRLESECGGIRWSDAQEGLTASLEEAKGLATYLYEHAVGPECWRGVAVDVLKTIHGLF